MIDVVLVRVLRCSNLSRGVVEGWFYEMSIRGWPSASTPL